MAGGKDSEADRKAEADAILERVNREAETLGGSSAKRAANRARDHFMAKDADPGDREEIWGRRIGRGLSILFLFGLVYYLAVTYL